MPRHPLFVGFIASAVALKHALHGSANQQRDTMQRRDSELSDCLAHKDGAAQVPITPPSFRVISTVDDLGREWPSLAGKLSSGCCTLIHMAR